MKKITLFLTAALLMGTLFTACQKEESRPHSIRFYATVENNSKIFYDGNLQNLMWNFAETGSDMGDDQILIFDDNGVSEWFTPAPPEGYTQSYGPAAVFVNDDLDEHFNQNADSYLAIHGMFPASFQLGTDTDPNIYYQEYWNFGYCNFPMMARSSSIDPFAIHFKHVFAYLKIRTPILTDEEYGCRHEGSISVTANKPIGGYFAITTDANGDPIARILNQTECDQLNWYDSYNDYLHNEMTNHMCSYGSATLSDTAQYYDHFWPIPAGDYDELEIRVGYHYGYITRTLNEGSTLHLTRGSVTPITITLREGEPYEYEWKK